MRARLMVPVLLVLLAPHARGQALPAGEAAPISTGFSLPHTAGTLNYAVSASETLTSGYYANSGIYAATNLSGDLAFLSGSKLYPFSLVFSGGYGFATSGQSSYGYVNLAMSQEVNLKRWTLLVSDDFSYMPGTPTTGISGIPGVGDLGVPPVGPPGQGVLTNYSNRISNTVSGSIQRQLTGKTSFNGFGSYSTFRFLGSGSEGLDDNSTSGGGGFTHQLDVRNSFGGNYQYSNFSYPVNGLQLSESGFASQVVSGQYTHQFSRRLSATVSAGPEWTKISSTTSQNLSVYASASASYQAKDSVVSVYYSRGTTAGYGVIPGGLSQGGGVTLSRTIARVWNVSASGSYSETSALPGTEALNVPYSFDTTVGGVQASRAIMRSLSIYGSYSYQHQTRGGSTAVDVFSGHEQVVGFGITYSPGSIHVGRQ